MSRNDFNPNNFPRRNHGYEREEPGEETISGNALRFVHESDVKAPTFERVLKFPLAAILRFFKILRINELNGQKHLRKYLKRVVLYRVI